MNSVSFFKQLKFRDLVAGKKNYIGLLGKSIKKKSMDMIKKEIPSNNNIVEETSSIFFISEKIVKILFGMMYFKIIRQKAKNCISMKIKMADI